MSKGITLTEDEMRRMLNAMRRRRSNARNRRTVVRAETVVSTEEVSDALDTKPDEEFERAASSDAMVDTEILAEATVAAETGELEESETALQ